MSCNPNSQNDSHGWLGDVSSSTLDGLDAHIDDLRARGITPSIIGKAGGPVGDVYDIYQIGKAAMEGGWTPALVNLSSALGGAAGAAIAIAFVGTGFGAAGIIAIGAASYFGRSYRQVWCMSRPGMADQAARRCCSCSSSSTGSPSLKTTPSIS
ncbi:MAG: hypothetical protein ACOYYF_15115, partial [Chloroflexota bacterium]